MLIKKKEHLKLTKVIKKYMNIISLCYNNLIAEH